jgi:CRISPR/Cas system-associated endoribonuclease Cas2
MRVGFRYAENIFKVIEHDFDKLNKEEVDLIVKYSISNNQIWGAAKCIDTYLPKLLKLRKNEIEKDLFKIIKYQLKNQKWYP